MVCYQFGEASPPFHQQSYKTQSRETVSQGRERTRIRRPAGYEFPEEVKTVCASTQSLV